MFRKKGLAALILLALAGVTASSAADIPVYDTDTIVVTSKRYTPPFVQAQKEQSHTTDITAAEIEQHQYQSVQEALKNVNGVTVTEQVPGTTAYVRLNGDDRVVVLVDGQAITNSQSAAYGRGTVDLQSLPGVAHIDHIEVTKGSGSVKYGSGAVGGVINIITKRGNESQTTLDVNTGSWGTHNYSLMNSGASGNTSWYVTGTIGHRSYYKFNDAGYTTDKSRGDYSKDGVTARIDQQLSDTTSLTLQATHSSFAGHTSAFAKNKQGLYAVSSNKRVERLNNNYTVTYHFGEDTDREGFIRYFNNYSKNLWTYHFHSRMQGVQAENTWNLGHHQLTGGLEWTKDEGSNAEAGYVDKKRTNRAVYIEDVITMGKWTVTPGLRIDDNSQFGVHRTPRVAMNYKANDKVNIYANWSRVFAAPKLNDLYYWLQTGKKTSTGNPDLQPESGYTQSLGMSYQVDSKTNLSVNLFHSSLSDAIRWERSATYARVRNLNREDKRGIEITLSKIVNDHWDYELGYSYIHTKIDEGKGMVPDTTFNKPNGYHGGFHFHRDKWKANVVINAGTGRNDDYYLHGSYVTWDVSASYDVTKSLTLYGQVNNLTNEGYDLYHDYPSGGRCWLIGAKYTF